MCSILMAFASAALSDRCGPLSIAEVPHRSLSAAETSRSKLFFLPTVTFSQISIIEL